MALCIVLMSTMHLAAQERASEETDDMYVRVKGYISNNGIEVDQVRLIEGKFVQANTITGVHIYQVLDHGLVLAAGSFTDPLNIRGAARHDELHAYGQREGGMFLARFPYEKMSEKDLDSWSFG